MKASYIKPGIYKHYKGSLYKVHFIVRHSETLELMVLYEHLDESDNRFWVRPLKMFKESVSVNGKRLKRFEFVK